MQIDDALTKRIHMKMSGCPNGCSQHHLANIGFYGASMKVGDRQMPAYIPHLGGSTRGRGAVWASGSSPAFPPKRVPDAVERWVRHYEEKRTDGEQSSTTSSSASAPRRSGADQGPVRPRRASSSLDPCLRTSPFSVRGSIA